MVWPQSDPEAQAQIAAFRHGLRSLGWTEGRNITLDVRWSSAEVTVVQRFAKELTDLRPDVFLATGTPAVNAILRETRSAPIVFTQVTDPVAQGLVKSLERPGGSMTGITIFEPEIGGKWLQVLKEMAPTSVVCLGAGWFTAHNGAHKVHNPQPTPVNNCQLGFAL